MWLELERLQYAEMKWDKILFVNLVNYSCRNFSLIFMKSFNRLTAVYFLFIWTFTDGSD